MVQRLAMLLLCGVLAVAARSDWRTGRIPNWLTLPAMLLGLAFWSVAGLVGSGWSGAGEGLGRSGLALGVGVGLMLLASANGGDVKLMGAVGALCASWRCVLATALYGLVIAALMAIVIMVRQRIVRRTFGRVFRALASLVVPAPPPPPARGPLVPLGAALGLGGLLAGLEYLLGIRLPWGG